MFFSLFNYDLILIEYKEFGCHDINVRPTGFAILKTRNTVDNCKNVSNSGCFSIYELFLNKLNRMLKAIQISINCLFEKTNAICVIWDNIL